MSAATCIVYYGLRFDVSPSDIEHLETRSDERLVAARNAGLNVYWGNFGPSDVDERYLLFLGAPIGFMGVESQAEVQFSDADFEALRETVHMKLAGSGLDGTPRLYVQWQDDA